MDSGPDVLKHLSNGQQSISSWWIKELTKNTKQMSRWRIFYNLTTQKLVLLMA